jgi:hypothetical protein
MSTSTRLQAHMKSREPRAGHDFEPGERQLLCATPRAMPSRSRSRWKRCRHRPEHQDRCREPSLPCRSADSDAFEMCDPSALTLALDGHPHDVETVAGDHPTPSRPKLDVEANPGVAQPPRSRGDDAQPVPVAPADLERLDVTIEERHRTLEIRDPRPRSLERGVENAFGDRRPGQPAREHLQAGDVPKQRLRPVRAAHDVHRARNAADARCSRLLTVPAATPSASTISASSKPSDAAGVTLLFDDLVLVVRHRRRPQQLGPPARQGLRVVHPRHGRPLPRGRSPTAGSREVATSSPTRGGRMTLCPTSKRSSSGHAAPG